MLTAKRHNELVDFIMDQDRFETPKELADEMVRRFSDVTFPDLDKAMADAADRLKERQAELDAEAEAMLEFMPLFEGEPEGSLLGEIAIRKAAGGDPLAIKFLASIADDEL
jgi:hypothetical protein